MFFETKISYEKDGKNVKEQYIFENEELFGEVEAKLYEEFGNFQDFSVMSIKKKAAVTHAVRLSESGIVNQSRYRTRTVPSAGAILKPEDAPEKQISFEV